MILLLNLVIILALIWIFYEDMKFRHISLYALIVVFVLSLIRVFTSNIPKTHEISLSFLIIISITTLIVGYLTLRHGYRSIFKNIGLGDFVFLLLFPFLLNPEWILYTIISGAIVSIIGILLFKSFKEKGAPLAGIYGLITAFILTIKTVEFEF